MTSGTIFHSRKLPFDQLLELVFRFAESAKGTSACELGISMETSYSALWHNLMKLREVMASRRQDLQLEGTIEMDAAWFGGIVRKKNKKADRKLDENDRRKAQHKQGKRVIMVVRQRGGSSLMFAADSETREVAITAARELVRIDENTKFVTDQELAYRDLGAFADHNWVNHKKMFDKDGVNTNLAESSFSRARRSEIGVYHKLSATWMDFYAGEMCWREDRNRMGNLQQAVDILELRSPIPSPTTSRATTTLPAAQDGAEAAGSAVRPRPWPDARTRRWANGGRRARAGRRAGRGAGGAAVCRAIIRSTVH